MSNNQALFPSTSGFFSITQSYIQYWRNPNSDSSLGIYTTLYLAMDPILNMQNASISGIPSLERKPTGHLLTI